MILKNAKRNILSSPSITIREDDTSSANTFNTTTPHTTEVTTPKTSKGYIETPATTLGVYTPYTHENDTMRGLFFIVKGQYTSKVLPVFTNRMSGDEMSLGCYNPEADTTKEWYQLLDCVTFSCYACGSNLEKILRSVYHQIKHHKGSFKKYCRFISEFSSDDTYEVLFLGKPPMSDSDRAKKAEGRTPRTSPIMKHLYEEVYKTYGDFMRDEISEMENLAYKELREETPLHKTKKVLERHKNTLKTPVEMVSHQVSTPVGVVCETKVKLKIKKGVRKLPMTNAE